jgi:hypothetical protein
VPTDGDLNPGSTIGVTSPSNPLISGRYHISTQIPGGTDSKGVITNNPLFAQNDFAIITVKQYLGSQQDFSLPPSEAFSGGTVNVTGYPFAGSFPLPGAPQFNDFGTVTPDVQGYAALDWISKDPTSLVDDPGDSGGPLWTMSGSTATAWGIVSNSKTATISGVKTTAGYNVQLTPPDVTTIQTWERQARTILGIGTFGNFTGSGTSGILFSNQATGDTWLEVMSNGAFDGWQQIGGSDTSYAEVGVGDFYGTGTDDILFRNNSTGDTWIETISNGAFASWNQIGGSNTQYSVVGVGDFFGNGTDDILFRNKSTGDTWLDAISNGAFAGWQQIGGSDTSYSAVGVGDFFGNGTDDILFRNNSTGDTWIETISNGAFSGWQQIGGSDTHYSVAGVGDFFGNGLDDILFRNNTTGDTWVEAISNGAFAGWNQIGGSDTSYSVVAVGDYFGNGTDDILFRNNSTGDTWFEAISNGASAGWNQIGGSNTSYTVKT